MMVVGCAMCSYHNAVIFLQNNGPLFKRWQNPTALESELSADAVELRVFTRLWDLSIE